MLTCDVTAISPPSSVAQDELDWNEFYPRQFDRIYRLILRSGVPTLDAEDLVQQTFLVAHRRMNQGIEIENPGAWVRAVALKVVADYYRWRKVRRLKTWLLPYLPGVVPERSDDPEAEASNSQLQEQITTALAQLSPKLRDAFVLLEVEQLSLDEAALILNAPSNTLRSRRRLALEALRRHMPPQHRKGNS